MLATETLERLTSQGHELDRSPDCLGPLRGSSDIADDAAALRQRMEAEGYLFLPGALDRDLVFDARRVMTDRLAAEGHLDPAYPSIEGVANPETKMSFYPNLSKGNKPLMDLLYDGRMMAFFERFLGGPVRHFDYTWLRAVSPGRGTPAHCDIVYMGRGTQRLYTAWTPLGDIPLEMGGLMILEGSNRNQRLRETYCRMDVDSYCTNRPGRKDSWAKGQGGFLSRNAVQIRRSIGGRWLTGTFRAGDVLVFSVHTVHASVDNQSDRIRLSSDTRYQLASEPADERWIGENPIAHGKAGKRGRIC